MTKRELLLTSVATAPLVLIELLDNPSTDGWYLRGDANYGSLPAYAVDGDVASSLGLGYDFDDGNNWRMELDGKSLWDDFGSISQPAVSFSDYTNQAMLNSLYSFDDFGHWVTTETTPGLVVNDRCSKIRDVCTALGDQPVRIVTTPADVQKRPDPFKDTLHGEHQFNYSGWPGGVPSRGELRNRNEWKWSDS